MNVSYSLLRPLVWISLSSLFISQMANGKTFYLPSHSSSKDTKRTISSSQLVDREESYSIGVNGASLEVTMTFSTFDATPMSESPLGPDFSKLKVVGLENSQEPGLMSLPFKSFIVRGSKEDLTINSDHTKEAFFKELMILPAPQKPCRCPEENGQKIKQPFYYIDPTYTQEGESGPIEVKNLGDFRGTPFSLVTIRPFKQEVGGLRVYDQLKVTIKSKLASRGENLLAQALSANGNRMLVISPRKLQVGAESFRTYKEEEGMLIDLFTYEDVATNAQELKQFIYNSYLRENYDYAVLLGHSGLLPTFEVVTSSSSFTPSDYPYFAFGGAEDVFPDIFYGRIVADTNEEVLNQVKKFREFRDESWRDNSGARAAIGIASNEGFGPTDVEYMKSMMSPLESSLNFSISYFFQDDLNSNPQDINTAINSGARWFNYIGHGSGDSWSSITEGEYHVSDLAGLRPGHVKPVIIDVACQNGRYSYENKLGERFMNKTFQNLPVGSVAFYGGSVDISWDPPAIMAVAIGEELGRQTTTSLFELIMKGQRTLIETYSDTDAAKENLLWYQLLGDPSLEVNSF